MAVTAFDGNFSFRQEELARMGGHEPTSMSKEQWAEFQDSPFMKSMRKADEICIEKTRARDEKRGERDDEFKPVERDWTEKKSYDFDKAVNYYKALGVDELASLKEIKQAYQRLSLIFHPDKSAGMTPKEKEDHNAIFIELKNAYKTLTDQPTRRQYDRERDRDLSVQEVNGWKPKTKKAFDATELLKKLQEQQMAPGKTVDIPMKCRLEKYFWGGFKSHSRERQVKDFVGFTTEDKTFRIDIPRGAPADYAVTFKCAGDHQEETQPDTLRFTVEAKPHDTVDRQGDDLVVKKKVVMRPDAYSQPFLSGQVESVRGHHLVFWGRNPFFHTTPSGNGELKVKVNGEGINSQGALRFTVKLHAAANDEDMVVVRMRQKDTNAMMALRMPRTATIGDLQDKAGVVLDFLGSQKVKIMKATADGYKAYADEQPLGAMRSVECGGTKWDDVPMTYESVLNFLHAVVGIYETEAFQTRLSDAYKLIETKTKLESEKRVKELWQEICDVLPDYGYDSTMEQLKELYEKSMKDIQNDPDVKSLRVKCKNVVIGFDPEAHKKQGPRLRVPRGKGRHPSMASRAEEWLTGRPKCEVELSPLHSEPITLAAKPACSVRFYSNGRQAAIAPPGRLRPRLTFAFAVTCETCSKKSGLEEWGEHKETLFPIIEDTFFLMLRRAHGIQPKSVADKPAFPDDAYLLAEDVVVTAAGEKTPFELEEEQEEDVEEEEDDDDPAEEEEAEDEDEDDDDCGGGMFDFDDMEGAADKKKKKEEREAAKQKRRETRKLVRAEMKRDSKADEKRRAAAERAAAREGGAADQQRVPWDRIADADFRQGNFFLAMTGYSRYLAERDEASDDVDARCRVLMGRSVCFTEIGHLEGGYEDAKAAVALKGTSGSAWSCLGAATMKRGDEFFEEARNSYFKAVQFEPTSANAKALYECTKAGGVQDISAQEEEKGKGNAAMKVPDLGLAVAHYTVAAAMGGDQHDDDQKKVLMSVLFSNRSLAFSRLHAWESAVADAQTAVATTNQNAKAYYRLGTALLGCGREEHAYSAFASGLNLQPNDAQLRAGVDNGLSLMALWGSMAAKSQRAVRRDMDLSRPRGSSKVYAMSDLHFDHKHNDEWVGNIDLFQFQEDVLIVAGNIADTLASLVRCLKALKAKFRRVFFTPGNHEMWIHPTESAKFPDSIAKFNAILEVCSDLGVDVLPAAITEDCYVVPLFSWYNAEFDESDPFPDPKTSFDQHCRWPLDVNEHVWRFFIDLNKPHMKLKTSSQDTVISFSHFLPQKFLPFDKAAPKIAKVMGCEEIMEQIKEVKSKLHIYGHARKKFAKNEEGVQYISHHLGYENEHTDKEPIMLVYNGQNICNRIVPIAPA